MKRKGLIRPRAIAHVKGGSDAPHLTGEVRFYPKRNGVLVVAHVVGLPQDSDSGFFALHIHAGKSCGGEDFLDTGVHYNPDHNLHPKHAGDLPPLLSCDGQAYLSVLTDRFSIQEVVGRTVVIHSDADDFHTQPAGNAGTKIACGVIYAY